jgi:membrane-bound transcription factor site-1 protease
MSVTGKVSGEPIWHPYKSQNGEFLDFSFQYSEVIWPWSGFLAVFITASKDAKNFEGIAQGHVSITIESPTEEGCTKNKTSLLKFLYLFEQCNLFIIEGIR